MPGFDRTQQPLLGQADLDQALAVFGSRQAALMAELLNKQFKKPSVFTNLSITDAIYNYSFAGSDPQSKFWLEQASDNLSVFVFDLQDAHRIRISLQALSVYNSQLFALCFGLSVYAARNAIPSNQFAPISGANVSFFQDSLASAPDVVQGYLWGDVETAGYKYLHLFGVIGGEDLLASFSDGGVLGYLGISLVK